MKLCAIVAVAKNNVIGNRGKIPWDLPADFAHVQKITMGHPIIMGSATHDSIGRALPGRLNVVINNINGYKVAAGAVGVKSLDEALGLDAVKKAKVAFIFGGQSIYELAMPRLQKIYLTRVHATPQGDRFFKFNPGEWEETSREEHHKDNQNPYDYDFIVLVRRNAVK